MMNGTSPVPVSSPTLPISADLPSSSGSLEADQFPDGPPPCTGCGQPILDEFILRVQGHLWHGQCLRCGVCQTQLTQTCYIHDLQCFCRTDFFRLFGAECAGCGEMITPTEAVRTAQNNIYHLTCFTCVLCSAPLNTGDQFYMNIDRKLVCQQDYEVIRQREAQAAASAEHPEGGRQDPRLGQQLTQPTMGHPSTPTFTPHETEILLNIYRAIPNPSHDMLQQISSQHGLDFSRVRMWFHVHRKESSGMREEGASYGVPAEGMDRVVAPLGGYPLPIVNEVSPSSSGRLPASSRSDVMGDVPFPMTSSCSRPLQAWPLADDVLRPDFVPPNVDLSPSDIKNGEVCTSRRGLPPSPMTPGDRGAARGQFYFMSGSGGKDGNGQQEQITAQGAEVPSLPPWLDS